MESKTKERLAPLVALRSCISANKDPIFLDESSNAVQLVYKASKVHFPVTDEIFDLNKETAFARQDNKSIGLKAVLFAWECRNASVTDYIKKCQEYGIINLSFLERSDLVAWLQGADSSELIKDDTKPSNLLSSIHSAKSVYNNERSLVDHNSILHGIKATDFSSVRKDVAEYLSRHQSQKSAKPILSKPKTVQKSTRKKDPIIILSPSASSVISMHNVKAFLGQGKFIPPEEAIRLSGESKAPELVAVSHTTNRVKKGEIRFIIVDGVDQFKPDYWDRVVCIFTTGQKWQFRDYKYPDPVKLFHAFKGILVQYSGEPAHPASQNWNVDLVRIDKNKRHTDQEIVSGIWDKIETWMRKNWSLWDLFEN